MMHFEPCERSDLKYFGHYADSLSSPIDSFLEDHILGAQFQRILIDSQAVGGFGVHSDTLLTHFHMVGPARRYGQAAFAQILAQTRVTAAMLPTCDEFFLSHALDQRHTLKNQAYFFVEGDANEQRPTPPSQIEVRYRLAQLADAEAIRAVSADFLDKLEHRIVDGEIYMGWHDDALVAVGITERSHLFPRQASIGMFTHEAHRQKGIGTRTIRYLRGVCHAEGIRPIAGCAYSNQQSKQTLEAAGMITQTRLLWFEFGR